jgi:hypothetical protein
VRGAGAAVLVVVFAGCVAGGVGVGDRVGNITTWGEEKWEAFKNDDATG